MANCNSNCGCGRCGQTGGARMGALNSLCRSCSSPYYTGPCPSTCDCGCAQTGCTCSGCTGCQSCACSGSIYASFTVSGPITVAAGGAVPLTASVSDADAFTVSGGSIALRCPGAYLALYAVNIPADTAVDTTTELTLNGRALAPSAISVVTSTDAASHGFTSAAAFTAQAGDIVSLTSASALSISAATSQPVFALTIVKL